MFYKVCKYLIFILFVIMSANLFSQVKKDSVIHKEKHRPGKFDNFVFGGFIGLQFGTTTLIDISPNIGYYFTPKVLGGVGMTYEYYSQTWYEKRISSSIYGGRLFNEYVFFDNIGSHMRIKSNFALYSHFEYEALNMDRDFSDMQTFGKTNRFWLHGILVGGGLKQNFGKHSSLNISILYNIIADIRSPYTNPLVRIGFYL
jgi:hypothetical protein